MKTLDQLSTAELRAMRETAAPEECAEIRREIHFRARNEELCVPAPSRNHAGSMLEFPTLLW